MDKHAILNQFTKEELIKMLTKAIHTLLKTRTDLETSLKENKRLSSELDSANTNLVMLKAKIAVQPKSSEVPSSFQPREPASEACNATRPSSLPLTTGLASREYSSASTPRHSEQGPWGVRIKSEPTEESEAICGGTPTVTALCNIKEEPVDSDGESDVTVTVFRGQRFVSPTVEHGFWQSTPTAADIIGSNDEGNGLFPSGGPKAADVFAMPKNPMERKHPFEAEEKCRGWVESVKRQRVAEPVGKEMKYYDENRRVKDAKTQFPEVPEEVKRQNVSLQELITEPNIPLGGSDRYYYVRTDADFWRCACGYVAKDRYELDEHIESSPDTVGLKMSQLCKNSTFITVRFKEKRN